MKWLRHIFKIDAIYTNIMPLSHLFLIYGLFLSIFIVLDGIYWVIINLANADQPVFHDFNLLKYFLIPLIGVLAIQLIDFASTYLCLYRRSYEVKNFKDHYLAKSALIQHFLYKKDDYLEANLITKVSPVLLYDTYFVSSYRGAYIGHHHTVLEIKLPKEVPHLIFNSHQMQGQQFTTHFQSAKEVKKFKDLNDSFDVYMAKAHNLATVSFLSSSVRSALLALRDCDIEFIDDRLLCYAPLLPADKFDQFLRLADDLYKALELSLKKYKLSLNSSKSGRLDRIIVRKPLRLLIIFLIFIAVSLLSILILIDLPHIWSSLLIIFYSTINLAVLVSLIRATLIKRQIVK